MTEIDGTGKTAANGKGVEGSKGASSGEAVDESSETSTESPLLNESEAAPEYSKQYERYMESVYGGNRPPGQGGVPSAEGSGEAVSAHELQAQQSAAESGRSERVDDLKFLLEDKQKLIAEGLNGDGEEWTAEDGWMSHKEPDNWADAYRQINFGSQRSRDIQGGFKDVLAGADGRMSDEAIQKAVSEHRSDLEAQGAFENWTEQEVDQWEQGVETFLKGARAKSELQHFDAGSVEGLPKLEMDPAERSYEGREAEIRSKLDEWEQNQLERFDSLVEQADEVPADLSVETMRDRIKHARETYEQITIGEKGEEPLTLPKEAPQSLEGEPEPVREPYVEHLEKNPGDLLGAYKVLEEKTEYARRHRAAKSAQFGVPKMFGD